MTRLRFYIILLLFLTFTGISPAFAEGHWKLVDVSHHQGENIADLRIINRKVDYSSSSGSVTINFNADQLGHKIVLSSTTTWSPPPVTARAGQKWRPGGSGSITENPRGFECYANPIFSNQHGGFNKDMTEFTFEKGWPGAKLEIGAMGRLRCSYPYIEITDAYVYKYEWVDGPVKAREGHLRILIKHSFKGAVKDAVFTIKDPSTNRSWTMTTNESGMAMQKFKVPVGASSFKLIVTEVMLTPKTKYMFSSGKFVPSYLNGINNKIRIGKTITLSQTNNYMYKYQVGLPVIGMTIKPLKWVMAKDKSRYQWVPCPAFIKLKKTTTDAPFMIRPDSFAKSGDDYMVNAIIPIREVLGTGRLYVFGYEKESRLKNISYFKIPGFKDAGKTFVVNLKLCGTIPQLARLRNFVYQYYKPIVGEKYARLIAEAKFEFDSSHGTPYYKDGVIYLPDNIDLTSDEDNESLMHEWTHHIMQVILSDPYVAWKLGGKHGPWTKAPNPELAWDEGRAHFFSMLMTRGMKIPYNPDSFKKEHAEKIAVKTVTSGNYIEGVITASLVDFYTEAGYKKTTDIIKNFIEVSEYCKKTKGHPPRNSDEFYIVLADYFVKAGEQGRMNRKKAIQMEGLVYKIRNRWRVKTMKYDK